MKRFFVGMTLFLQTGCASAPVVQERYEAPSVKSSSIPSNELLVPEPERSTSELQRNSDIKTKIDVSCRDAQGKDISRSDPAFQACADAVQNGTK